MSILKSKDSITIDVFKDICELGEDYIINVSKLKEGAIYDSLEDFFIDLGVEPETEDELNRIVFEINSLAEVTLFKDSVEVKYIYTKPKKEYRLRTPEQLEVIGEKGEKYYKGAFVYSIENGCFVSNITNTSIIDVVFPMQNKTPLELLELYEEVYNKQNDKYIRGKVELKDIRDKIGYYHEIEIESALVLTKVFFKLLRRKGMVYKNQEGYEQEYLRLKKVIKDTFKKLSFEFPCVINARIGRVTEILNEEELIIFDEMYLCTNDFIYSFTEEVHEVEQYYLGLF